MDDRDALASVTRVLRRRLRSLSRSGERLRESVLPTTQRPVAYDSWLLHYYGELLEALDLRCRDPSGPDYGWFRDLDDDLWAILLSKQYSVYPNLRRALPDLPSDVLQTKFTGHSGDVLTAQSKGFYRRLKDLYGRHGAKPLSESRVLDFGCGWGRLTRYLGRDVAPEHLFGCDPNLWILDVCKQTRVPARFAGIEEIPTALPFRERFDLIFAFSVFTHLSEAAHKSCLKAIHAGLEPSGVLVLTIRPPAFITDGFEGWGLESHGDVVGSLMGAEPTYAFAPQTGGPLKPGTYGAAVINLPYIRERWGELFTLVDVTLQMDQIYQVVVTLRRREAGQALEAAGLSEWAMSQENGLI